MSYAIGVVGATGQVGREFLRILEEGDRPGLPISSVRLFASERSAGKRITVRGESLVVERAAPDPERFKGLDFVLTAIGDEHARIFSPAIARAGALNVDKSNAWRMDPHRAAGGARGQSRRRAAASRHHRRSELLDDADGGRAVADSSRQPHPAHHRRHVSGRLGHGLAGGGRAARPDSCLRQRRATSSRASTHTASSRT